jgi:hypothetical protein
MYVQILQVIVGLILYKYMLEVFLPKVIIKII